MNIEMTRYAQMESCFGAAPDWDALCTHQDWRVRCAAAVAIGERGDPALAPYLENMMTFEETRSLYDQPKCEFAGSADGTRMSEQIGPITAVFEHPHSSEVLEAWKCRGRVKFACAKAVVKIRTATPKMRELFRVYLENESEAYNVKAATANALAVVGTGEDIPYLEKSSMFDEWCTQMESQKALKAIRARS